MSMKRSLVWLAAVCATLAVVGGCNPGPGSSPPEVTAAPGGLSGAVVSVADGDTFTMMTSVGEKIKVRLLGVDAPEVAHGGDTADCGADAAHDALEELLSEGTSVDVVFDLRADRYDRYGRALGYVSTDVVDDVALRLLDAGLVEAWIPAGEPQPERFAEYREAQSRAQDAGVGAWVGCDTLGR